MTTRPDAPAIIDELRDGLARLFADEMARVLPAAVDILQHQLAVASREQWKAVRGAIDLLAVKKPAFAAQVAKSVAARFEAKRDPGSDPLGKTARFSLDSLSLVADDEVQEEIAIGNATRRLREQLGEELFALTHRLAALMGIEALPDDQRNPVFPRIFTRGLFDALGGADASSAACVAAFTAFGPAMLDAIHEVYRDANRRLAERGVLPDFKRSYGAPQQVPARVAPSTATSGYAGAPAPAGAAAVAAAGAQASVIPATSPLERIFATVRGRAAADPMPAPSATPGLVTVEVRPELVEALRGLEQRLPPPAGAGGAASTAGDVHRAKLAMGGALNATDSVVADLVAALFDRLLADRRIPDGTKAQVGRLQLPVFKAVMRDPALFADARHPIRQLIDGITELGACDPRALVDDCSPEEWVAAAVQNIVDGADDDPQLFTRERDQLAAILVRVNETALENDPEVLALRAREKDMVAVREATLAIAHRVAAAGASNKASSYLYRCWRDVMVHDYLDGGDESADWALDLEVVDDIMWVLVPRTAPEERARLTSLLPSLIYRMRLGYARARVELAANARVEELRQLLDGVVRAPLAAVHGLPMPAAAGTTTAPFDDYTATLQVSGALREEGLTRGAWVEFRDPGQEPRRCRLTWVSPVQGACVFKDLDRNRSFPIAIEELRERRRVGTAVMVDGPGIAAASVDAALADVARGLAVG
jgi:hypothetical protein